MNVAKLSAVFLFIVLSLSLAYTITYSPSYTSKQIPVTLRIKSAVLSAVVDINPDSLRSKGKWITAYIELPEGYNVGDIEVSSIKLNDTVSAELEPSAIGDYDNDAVPDLMVKFNRAAVISYILSVIGNPTKFSTVKLTITGKLNDGTPFQGSDTIKIYIMPRYGRFIQ